MTFNDNTGIERELAPGERLLWKGRPQTGIKFRPWDAFLVPAVVLWCVWGFYAGYQWAMQLSPRVSFIVVIFVASVLPAFAFFALIGRFLSDAYTRGRMEYALTNQRALIVSNAFFRRVRSINYRAEPNILLTERSGGSGTIYFGKKRHGQKEPMSSSRLSGFDFIDNARDVYQCILKAKES